jgi:hypothetical protein
VEGYDYGELVENAAREASIELAGEAYRAGYGKALLELQQQQSGGYWEARVIEAALNEQSTSFLGGDDSFTTGSWVEVDDEVGDFE